MRVAPAGTLKVAFPITVLPVVKSTVTVPLPAVTLTLPTNVLLPMTFIVAIPVPLTIAVLTITALPLIVMLLVPLGLAIVRLPLTLEAVMVKMSSLLADDVLLWQDWPQEKLHLPQELPQAVNLLQPPLLWLAELTVLPTVKLPRTTELPMLVSA